MNKFKNKAKTVAVATLGCKVNQFESASFQSGFAAQGFELTSPDKPADIYIINTCAVTSKAAAQSRQLIRRVKRNNPGAKLVVTGCYAQIAPQQVREITDSAATIVGNANKHQLVQATLSDADGAFPEVPVGRYFKSIMGQIEISPLPVNRFSGRTRAILKVQDGCNNFCSYCIVPYARGRSRSLEPEKLLEQARIYDREGHREIVLTGIHVGLYGLDLEPQIDLLYLLHELSTALPGVRFRLSSLEPTEISPPLLKFMLESNNFMPHLHIPLQSGSNRILQKMNRRYSAEQFSEIVHQCKNMVPDAAVGVDILVGFPGETEEDFQRTYELVAGLPVTYLHIFPYSKRPGTPAAEMKQQIQQKIKADRVAVLKKLDHKKRNGFYESRIGKVHPVLVETIMSANGLARGFTDNYIPVQFKAGLNDINQVVPVRLDKLLPRSVFGSLSLDGSMSQNIENFSYPPV